MHKYRINNFSIESAIELPADTVAGLDAPTALPVAISHDPDLMEAFSHVHWLQRKASGTMRAYDTGTGVVVGAAKQLRMFVAKDADRIVFSYPRPTLEEISSLDQAMTAKFNESLASALSVNLAMSICSLLTGRVPLHAATVEIENKVIGFMGSSGIGKSTLLWWLLGRGCNLGNDDVSPVHVERERTYLQPSRALHGKLSVAEAQARDYDIRKLSEVLPGNGEYWVPIAAADRMTDIKPVDALFVLRPADVANAHQIGVERMGHADAITALMRNTQGLWACYSLLNAHQLLMSYSAIAGAVPIYTLSYKRCKEALPALAQVMRDLSSAQPQSNAA